MMQTNAQEMVWAMFSALDSNHNRLGRTLSEVLNDEDLLAFFHDARTPVNGKTTREAFERCVRYAMGQIVKELREAKSGPVEDEHDCDWCGRIFPAAYNLHTHQQTCTQRPT